MAIPPDAKWKDIPLGGMIAEGGTSDEYNTGTWRSFRPIHHYDKCIHCMTCWILCPDSAIIVEDGKVKGMNYKHCKGCGICALECPKKGEAITMIREGDAGDE